METLDTEKQRRRYKNAWQNKFRAEHRTEVLAKQRAWYADRKALGLSPRPQPKRDAANKRTWHQKNKERRQAKKRSWYEQNRERGKELARQSYHRNKEAINARRYALRKADPLFALKARAKHHGILFRELKKLVDSQRGLCAICNRKVKLHIDHNHKTGMVRGLLCRACNTGIGMLQENPVSLRNAATYIETHAT